MRIESSIITSLSELRAIEQERIADERNAFERERAAVIEAKRAAEQAKLDAEQRSIREERDALMRIEQARLDAEREARMRVEAAQAAEHARLQAALDQQRMQEENELRRAEIAKKRPTWMLAVTGMALVATIGLGWYAVDRSKATNEAERAKQVAIARSRDAAEAARQAREELGRLGKQMDEQDALLAQAQKRLLDAQTQADRDRIAEDIRRGNEQKAKIRAQQAAAQAAAEAADRAGGAHFDHCLSASAGAIDCLDDAKKNKPRKK